MSDPRHTLQAKFQPEHRYATFGEVLVRMHIRGFRCHTDTVVEINSPITAFCGLNGTGKSTLLHLAAAAFKDPKHTYYISSFFVVGKLDPAPFQDEANVEFQYWSKGSRIQTLTISRSPRTARWSGYKRRPEKTTLFAGVGHYLPRIEQRDFVVRNAKHIEVTATRHVREQVIKWSQVILGVSYDQISENVVTYSGRSGYILSSERAGVTYSESHMGFGEGRTLYLVRTLETLPEKSLVLIEEPETSLHPSAQHALARYLMDVSVRKGHQIILTTHSEYLLSALPAASRIFLLREASGNIKCLAGLSADEAVSLMTDGHKKSLTILVEDECARAVLREILRSVDQQFLKTVGIYVGGDAKTLGRTVKILRETGLSVAAVRDGDMSESPSENIFKLPGASPPEKEIFTSKDVRAHILRRYRVSVDDLVASLGSVDHHDWIRRLAERVNLDKGALLVDLARIYANAIPENERVSLRDALREAVKR